MKADDLHELWTNGPKMRMSTQPYSFRLPIVIGAQIEALCEIYPQKNRTEIVTDLLLAAIEELEPNLPTEPILKTEDDSAFKGGMRHKFRAYSNGFFKMREKSWVEPIFLNEMEF